MARAPRAGGCAHPAGPVVGSSARSWLGLLAGARVSSAFDGALAFVVEPPRPRRVQPVGIEGRPGGCLPAAQDVTEGFADDGVGHPDRAIGELEAPDDAVAARGEEVAGGQLVLGTVVDGLARDAELDVELAGAAARPGGEP